MESIKTYFPILGASNFYPFVLTRTDESINIKNTFIFLYGLILNIWIIEEKERFFPAVPIRINGKRVIKCCNETAKPNTLPLPPANVLPLPVVLENKEATMINTIYLEIQWAVIIKKKGSFYLNPWTSKKILFFLQRNSQLFYYDKNFDSILTGRYNNTYVPKWT